MSPSLAADLASILKREPSGAATALEQRLAVEAHGVPVAELLELGARAARARSSDAELLLAVGTLLALHAPPVGPVRH